MPYDSFCKVSTSPTAHKAILENHVCYTSQKSFSFIQNSGQLLRPRTEFRHPTNPTQTCGNQHHSTFSTAAQFQYQQGCPQHPPSKCYDTNCYCYFGDDKYSTQMGLYPESLTRNSSQKIFTQYFKTHITISDVLQSDTLTRSVIQYISFPCKERRINQFICFRQPTDVFMLFYF